MSFGVLILLIAVPALIAGVWIGRKSIEKLKGEQAEQSERLRQRESTLENFKKQTASLQKHTRELLEANSQLHEIYSAALEKIRTEGALLPSAVRWANKLQADLDQMIVHRLETPPHPAPSAANQVREARELAREWREASELLRNRIDLYESQAPWLVSFAEYSLDEIIAGLQEERELGRAYASGDDPVRLFLTTRELGLSTVDRNQLALDRYWERSRNRSAWVAGVQYERYVGYLYEKEGFDVEYHGALRGKEDLGIDLVCRNARTLRIVQCKRLSPVKAIPVRENVVAQVYGSAMFFAMRAGMDTASVKPVVVTTFELSIDAKHFAELLGVSVRERVALEPYPCVKCNISQRTGERIYHLPFDQQYDSVKIDKTSGECYAMTVAEAERAQFRRAFRWHGSGQ